MTITESTAEFGGAEHSLESTIDHTTGVRFATRNGDKHPTAHDLRRSFGTRWAPLVKPLVLKELMRHSSIRTIEQFYVELDAQDTASAIRRGWETAVRKTR